ncbi:hypothetical protein E2C01_002041 [Portunus trituberculatus]|uniref:Uncharacterized protein n=1 Tax=Portunus trituberculatus TaxID=210409 RepID=A0A5B7CIU0_PORTR|nr:hypothetical protein [Portunus trituberculatus]
MYSIRKKYRALPIEIDAKKRSELVAFFAAVRHLVIIISHLATQLAIWQHTQLVFSCLSAHRALMEGVYETLNNPEITAGELKRSHPTLLQEVSERTIQHRLQELGLPTYKPAAKPLLTPSMTWILIIGVPVLSQSLQQTVSFQYGFEPAEYGKGNL